VNLARMIAALSAALDVRDTTARRMRCGRTCTASLRAPQVALCIILAEQLSELML